MKRTILILVLAIVTLLFGTIGPATGDSGPYYIYLDGYCDIYRTYLTPYGAVYMEDVGCGDLYPNGFIAGGGFTPQAILNVGAEYEGVRLLMAFVLGTSAAYVFINNGSSLTFTLEQPFHLGPAPTEATIESNRQLPAWFDSIEE